MNLDDGVLMPDRFLNCLILTRCLLRERATTRAVHLNMINATLKIIGIDDFAFQKARDYGTMIVNHENNKVVDLLPDRTSTTLST